MIDRPTSPDPHAWAWPNGWESLLGSSFFDINVGSHVIPVISVCTETVSTTDGKSVLIQRNSAGEIIPIVNVFEFVRNFSDRLDARRFLLGMRLNGTSFMVKEKSSLRITTPGAWARRCIHWCGRVASWSRYCTIDTDFPFVRMDEQQTYEYRLSAVIARLRRDVCGSDPNQDSFVLGEHYVYLESPYSNV